MVDRATLPCPFTGPPGCMDPELERYTAELEHRTARLALYLRIRAGVGLLLLASCVAGIGLAAAFLLAAVGLLDTPALTRWTSGFDAVLAVFMPSAFAWLTGRTGVAWWRHRRLEDPDPGCPVC